MRFRLLHDVKLRLQALRSLRWNYKLRGVCVWLGGRNCFNCGGKGKVISFTVRCPAPPLGEGISQEFGDCPRCHGKPKRGYQRILSEPRQVLAEQERAGAGVAW